MGTDLQSQPAYGEQMAKYFRLSNAQSLVISASGKHPIAVTRLTSNTGLSEQTAPIPPEKEYLISMHLTGAAPSGCELWSDGYTQRYTQYPASRAGSVTLPTSPSDH